MVKMKEKVHFALLFTGAMCYNNTGLLRYCKYEPVVFSDDFL